jgi:autotransporter-associated beta strand protein
VVDNAALVFNRSDALTFGGAISGTGSVGLASGTVNLTAVSSYTGATSVASGATLNLSGNGAIAASRNVAVDGTLDVSALGVAPTLTSVSGAGSLILGGQALTLTNASGDFAGTISGGGGLVLTGGTQILSGSNSYTGATVVKGGTLSVAGSAALTGVAVASGGTLSGTGTVGAIGVASGGTLSAGTSGSGTLTSTGDVVLDAGSIYAVTLSGSGAGKLATAGSASLEGTLAITGGSGYALGQKLTVLTAADGVTGTFSATQLQSTGATLKTAVSYDANNVYLQVDLAKLSPLLPSDAVTNAANAVGGVDAAIAAGSTPTAKFNGLANLSSDGLAESAAQLSGEVGAAAAGAGQALLDPFMAAVFDHLAQNIGNGGAARRPIAMAAHQAWGSGFAASGRMDGNDTDGSHDLKTTAAGFAGGADWALSPRLSLGAAFSVGSSNFRLSDDFGTGHATGIQAGIYGLAQYSTRLYASFAGIVAMDTVRTARTIGVSGSDTLEGKATGFMVAARYETGARFNWGTPYVALQDALFELPAYKESATAGTAAFALSYAAHSSNQASLELGLRQSFDIPVTRQWSLRVIDRLGYSATLSGGDLKTNAAFADLAASDFTVLGAAGGKSAALVTLGLGVHNRQGLSFDLRLDSRSSATAQTYTGLAGVNFAW